jgi:hypothetical protein
VLNDSRFEVIRHENPRHASEVGISIHVGGNPRLLILRQERFRVGVAAVRQG